jgi:hypothetical protein
LNFRAGLEARRRPIEVAVIGQGDSFGEVCALALRGGIAGAAAAGAAAAGAAAAGAGAAAAGATSAVTVRTRTVSRLLSIAGDNLRAALSPDRIRGVLAAAGARWGSAR